MLLQYYKCDTSGRLTEQICPDGLVFDIPGKELSAYIDNILPGSCHEVAGSIRSV